MHKSTPITDLLDQLQQGERATKGIYEHFRDKARQIAGKLLSSKLKGRVTATSIAHESLQKCIEGVTKMPHSLASRDEFEMLLTDQIKKRLSNAGEHATAQKRDISKETGSAEYGLSDSTSFDPVELAITDELAVQVVQNIFKEPNETKRAICLLGLLLDYPARMIQEMVQPLGDDSNDSSVSKKIGQPQYAISTIQLTLRNRRQLLRKELGLEDDSQDENVDQPIQ